MVDQGNKETLDIFIANSIYPNARAIFTHLQSLDEIKDACYIVLDTNVLLLPYSIGDEDLLEQVRKTYKPLSAKKRLIVPGQVAREFAKNRANKISELYQQLSDKKIPSMQRGKYPLLSSLENYQVIVGLEEEIDQKLEEYRKKYEKAVKEMLSHIQKWGWNDPVTLLYSEIFDEDTIVDPPIEEEALKSDLEHRLLNNIPPGYKDRGKDDSGIGDLLIWYTILEIGKTQKKSVIFVSQDEKADWQLRSKGVALYPRYELVDEFRRASEGQSFHMIKFSHFLELFGASKQVVQEVRQEEGFIQRLDRIERNITVHMDNWIVEAVKKWIIENYSIEPRNQPFLSSNLPDLEFVDRNGFSIAIEVQIVPNYKHTDEAINRMLYQATNWMLEYGKVLLFLVFPQLTDAAQALEILRKIPSIQMMDSRISLVVGHVEGREFLFLDIFPPDRQKL